MSKLGSVFGQEIARLARREARSENHATRKASVQHRKDIASLKREVSSLKRVVATLQRQAPAKTAVAPVTAGDNKLRFVRKGLQAQRKRLGLSAEGYGKLAGVSDQTVHNWEVGNSTPHPKHLSVIAAIRKLSKREAASRLAAMEGKAEGAARKTTKTPAKKAAKRVKAKKAKAKPAKAAKRAKRVAKS